MPGPLNTSLDTDVRIPGGDRVVIVATTGTTDGAGVYTVAAGCDYDGSLVVTKSGNNYIYNVGAFKRVLSAKVTGNAATSFHATGYTVSATAGTIQANFGASVNSATLDALFVLER
jgi:hypothetical protein